MTEGKVALNISTEQHMPMFCGSRFQSDIVRWKNDSCLCWILQDLDILPLSLSSQWNWHTLRKFPTPLSICCIFYLESQLTPATIQIQQLFLKYVTRLTLLNRPVLSNTDISFILFQSRYWCDTRHRHLDR